MTAYAKLLDEFAALDTPWVEGLEEYRTAACARTAERFLQALYREGMLGAPSATADPGELVWQNGSERLEVQAELCGAGDRLRLSDASSWAGTTEQQGRGLERMVARAAALSGAAWSSAWQALLEELQQGAAVQAAAYAAARHRPAPSSCADFEAWTPEGHNLHPGAKTRAGFTAAEMVAYAPDFAQHTEVPWIEIDAELISAWGSMPDLFRGPNRRWCLPVHPWQLQRVLPEVYAPEFASGRLLVSPRGPVRAAIGSSLRTLTPEADELPVLKLAVGALMTSSDRSISAHTARQGPIYTACLERIFEREHGFAGRVDFAPEPGGLAFVGDFDSEQRQRRARNLTLVLRRRSTAPPGLLPVACSALPQPRLHRPGTYFDEFFARGDGPMACFERYLELLIPFHLRLYAKYGLALEAHLQNCTVLWSDKGPEQLWVRDWGGLRAVTRSLADWAPDLAAQLHPGSVTYADRATAQSKLVACLYSNHLTEVVVGVGRAFGLAEDRLWRIVAQVSARALEPLRREHPFLGEPLAVQILTEDWWVKGLLGLRLGAEGEGYARRRNPLQPHLAIAH